MFSMNGPTPQPRRLASCVRPQFLGFICTLLFVALLWIINPGRAAAQELAPAAPAAPAALTTGYFHTCALQTDNSVACWGSNDNEQATAPQGVGFQQVTAGVEHTCGIKLDGTVLCWGIDANGSTVPLGGVFKTISGGFDHVCGIRSDDTLGCWGDPEGNQTTPPSGAFKSLNTGDYHSCAIRQNDTLACWGNNDEGQATPPGGSFKQVSAGEFSTCAIKSDDTVQCWGNNDSDQGAPPSGTFQAISAGAAHVCGLRPDGTLTCWGDNSSGQSNAPLGKFVSVSAGAYFTCAIRDDGVILCWGDNSDGQAPILELMPLSLPNGNQGVAYSQTLSATVENYTILTPTFTLVGGALPAGLTLNASTGSITGAPSFGGLYSFAAQMKDANGLIGQRAYSLKINTRPIANNQSVITGQDTPQAVSLTASDADGDTLIFTVVNQPAHGVVGGVAPNLVYTPSAGYSGADSFTFKVNDGQLDSTIATVSIEVTADPPPNTPPVADDQQLSLQNTATVPITLTASDNENDPLTYSVVTNPPNGTLSGVAPTLVYSPASGFTGVDTFTFKANDGAVDSNIATITITVTAAPPANTAPVAKNRTVTTPKETARDITLAGSDSDGDALTFAIVSGPLNGALSGSPPNITYTPNANFIGSDQFMFKVNDGQVDSAPATVTITVEDRTPVNTAPVANDQLVTTPQKSAKNIVLTGSDADGDPLTYVIVSVPAHGVLGGVAPNLIYTPTAAFSGLDSFTFRVKDGQSDSNVATVSINVTPVFIQATVTGVIFDDRNGNSLQEGTEAGLADIRVTLNGSNGFTQTLTTDNDGVYRFAQVPDGTYTLTVKAPVGYRASGSSSLVVNVTANGIITNPSLGFTELTMRPIFLTVILVEFDLP